MANYHEGDGFPVHIQTFATITQDEDLTSEANAGPAAGQWARWIDIATPGTLVVTVQPANVDKTIPAMPAGHRLFGRFSAIKDSGTTAAGLIVNW